VKSSAACRNRFRNCPQIGQGFTQKARADLNRRALRTQRFFIPFSVLCDLLFTIPDLSLTGLEVALLLNFKESRLAWKRVVRGQPE
jgi:hypothetical protein